MIKEKTRLKARPHILALFPKNERSALPFHAHGEIACLLGFFWKKMITIYNFFSLKFY